MRCPIWVRTAVAGLRLTRPLNCAIAAVTVAVGALTSGVWQMSLALLMATASAAAITAAGNVYNDLKDLDIDRINRPDRSLPSGKISGTIATFQALGLAIVGLTLAWRLGPVPGWLATGVTVGLVAYSSCLKRTGLGGNLLVSALGALAFPYGAIAMGNWGRSWIPAGYAFLFHLGREIIKDVEDAAGDQAFRSRSLPLVLGCRRASFVAAAIYLFLGVVTPMPWILGLYGLSYAVAIVLLDAVILVVLYLLLIQQRSVTDQFLSRLLTAAMGVGLAAVVLGEALP